MGLLYKTKCYLIGAMEYTQDGRGWREYIKSELEPLGINFFDPYYKPFYNDYSEDEKNRENLYEEMNRRNYDKVQERMWKVRATDLRCCDISDFLICKINTKIPTFGTIEELSWGVRIKRPIFVSVVGGKKNTPLWLMGMLPHKYFYDSDDDIINTIKLIDKEILPIDSERWRLLKPELR